MKKILLILSLCFIALGIVACKGGQSNNAYFVKDELKLQVGDSYKVQYVGEDVEIKSVDSEIANVSVTNVVTAIKEGQTKLHLVCDGDVLDELPIQVSASSYIAEEGQTNSSVYRIVLDATEKSNEIIYTKIKIAR